MVKTQDPKTGRWYPGKWTPSQSWPSGGGSGRGGAPTPREEKAAREKFIRSVGREPKPEELSRSVRSIRRWGRTPVPLLLGKKGSYSIYDPGTKTTYYEGSKGYRERIRGGTLRIGSMREIERVRGIRERGGVDTKDRITVPVRQVKTKEDFPSIYGTPVVKEVMGPPVPAPVIDISPDVPLGVEQIRRDTRREYLLKLPFSERQAIISEERLKTLEASRKSAERFYAKFLKLLPEKTKRKYIAPKETLGGPAPVSAEEWARFIKVTERQVEGLGALELFEGSVFLFGAAAGAVGRRTRAREKAAIIEIRQPAVYQYESKEFKVDTARDVYFPSYAYRRTVKPAETKRVIRQYGGLVVPETVPVSRVITVKKKPEEKLRLPTNFGEIIDIRIESTKAFSEKARTIAPLSLGEIIKKSTRKEPKITAKVPEYVRRVPPEGLRGLTVEEKEMLRMFTRPGEKRREEPFIGYSTSPGAALPLFTGRFEGKRRIRKKEKERLPSGAGMVLLDKPKAKKKGRGISREAGAFLRREYRAVAEEEAGEISPFMEGKFKDVYVSRVGLEDRFKYKGRVRDVFRGGLLYGEDTRKKRRTALIFDPRYKRDVAVKPEIDLRFDLKQKPDVLIVPDLDIKIDIPTKPDVPTEPEPKKPPIDDVFGGVMLGYKPKSKDRKKKLKKGRGYLEYTHFDIKGLKL